MQSEIGQVKGFSPECILRCVFRFPFSVKVLLQCLHSNGFSPVYKMIFIVCYVGSFMDLKSSRPWIAFMTLRTLKRFISWMNEFMSLQVSFCDKLFVTPFKIANIRPFPSLNFNQWVSLIGLNYLHESLDVF